MRVLILEDDMKRMVWFNKELEGNEIHHTDMADIAIDCLGFNEYDMIFLDHDLGGEQMVDGELEKNTGLTVARAIPDTKNKMTPVVIHSLNPVGANRMSMAILDGGNKDVTVAPFGSFQINRSK